MIEYIMIANVNSSTACAHELGTLLQGRKCMVNLIPYNTTEAGDRYDFQAPPDADIEAFAKVLYCYRDDKGKPLRCSIRWSSRRGQDIDAACGQLALKNVCSSSTNKSISSGDIEDLGTAKAKTNAKMMSSNGSGSKDRKGVDIKSEDSSRSASSHSWHKYVMVAGVIILCGTLLRKRKRT